MTIGTEFKDIAQAAIQKERRITNRQVKSEKQIVLGNLQFEQEGVLKDELFQIFRTIYDKSIAIASADQDVQTDEIWLQEVYYQTISGTGKAEEAKSEGLVLAYKVYDKKKDEWIEKNLLYINDDSGTRNFDVLVEKGEGFWHKDELRLTIPVENGLVKEQGVVEALLKRSKRGAIKDLEYYEGHLPLSLADSGILFPLQKAQSVLGAEINLAKAIDTQLVQEFLEWQETFAAIIKRESDVASVRAAYGGRKEELDSFKQRLARYARDLNITDYYHQLAYIQPALELVQKPETVTGAGSEVGEVDETAI